MFTIIQKALLRCSAAATLFVWLYAQVACFLHCHYSGNGSAMVSVEKKCCASRTAGDDHSKDEGPTSTCLTFKQVVRSAHAAILPAPELTLVTFAALSLLSDAQLPQAVATPSASFADFSPPPLEALLQSFHLTLPPPSFA